MATTLNIGIDLGSDTVKVAFAYQQGKTVTCGKFLKSGLISQSALPSIAYYDEVKKQWYFADQVDNSADKSFTTVVKIKSLLSLLKTNAKQSVFKSNKRYYEKGTNFPKFYFPVSRDMSADFSEMVNNEMTFLADETPKKVCEMFFEYVAGVVKARIVDLANETGVEFNKTIKIGLVHPSRTGSDYVDELSRLVKKAFGVAPDKTLSATKALSMLAAERGKLKKGDSVLVFDMGEQEMSVAKATLTKQGKLLVDGADGHNPPVHLGGNDIDRAVADYIEASIEKKETIGTPSYGQEGHIFEHGLQSKQYLFLKDIKKAKTILSMQLKENSVFANGVPLGIWRDLYIQRRIDKEQFQHCIGTKKGDHGSVAKKIVEYIISEKARQANHDVKKILLSGGLLETYSLRDYIKSAFAQTKVKQRCGTAEFLTFDDSQDVSGEFNITTYEDSTYAPSLGGAIVALRDIDVPTVVSLSYATWTTKNSKKNLDIFLEKGTEIPEGGHFFSTGWTVRPGTEKISNDEMYSTIATKQDVHEGNFYPQNLQTDEYFYRSTPTQNYWENVRLNRGTEKLVSESNASPQFKAAQKYIALTPVGGDGVKTIIFKQKSTGKRIRIMESMSVQEGILFDGEGQWTPQIVATSPATVKVEYMGATGTAAKLKLEDISVIIDGIKTTIDVEASD